MEKKKNKKRVLYLEYGKTVEMGSDSAFEYFVAVEEKMMRSDRCHHIIGGTTNEFDGF